jgi:hypothetical protein
MRVLLRLNGEVWQIPGLLRAAVAALATIL